MDKRIRWFLAVLAGAASLSAAAVADTSRAGAAVKIDGATGNVFAAGASVEITGDIEAGVGPRTAVFAAGASVNVSATVDGALFVTGGDVSYTGASEVLFASGGNVSIGGSVKEDAMIAGGNVMILEGAQFQSELHAAGASVDYAGSTTGDVNLAGAFVRLDGAVDGDAELAGEEIVIGPRARVKGGLTYYSTKSAEISPEAQITGAIVKKEESERDIKWERHKRNPFASRGDLKSTAYGALFWFVALGASGVLMALTFPKWFGEAAAAGRDHPLSSLLLGFAVLIALPVGSFLFMIMILGLPFGGFLLALYVGLLFISMIGAGLGFGHLLLDRSKDVRAKILLFIAGLAILLVVGAAPVIGPIVGSFAMLLGLGVLVRGLWTALRADTA
ncbi:MAG: hypothetical protein WD076_08630 [Parvularculaceae bacterium]